MYPNHQRTIDRVIAHFKDDPRFLALVIGGSVAKGWAAESSDVDIMLIATDEEFARRQHAHEYLYYTQEFSDYEGGYVDGKIIDLPFLEQVADHGSEVARAAFMSTWIAWSRADVDLAPLLKRIPVYPEAEREEKMKAFYSQVVVGNWFMMEADKRKDQYLYTHAADELALFGGRLMLAYNRMLYPYHKWFMHEVARAPEKPANFMELLAELLNNPCPATAQAYCDLIANYRDWGVTLGECFVRFTQDREWNWRGQRAPLHDW